MNGDKGVWNDFRRITKTRKPHKCAMTKQEIPAGSSCWGYVGEWEGEFQSWHCTDQAKEFYDANTALFSDWDGFHCYEIGEAMRERGLL